MKIYYLLEMTLTLSLMALNRLMAKSNLAESYYSLRFLVCLTAGAGFFSLGSGCLPVSSEVSISLISGMSLPICEVGNGPYNKAYLYKIHGSHLGELQIVDLLLGLGIVDHLGQHKHKKQGQHHHQDHGTE